MQQPAAAATPEPYPLAPNDLIDDPTPKDQAIYVPSVTPGFAIDVQAQNWKRALPNGVGPGDLNFLDPNNKLFRISHVMSSAGQALNQKKPCIVTARDRKHTLMIGDSGGYQIASGNLKINGDRDRRRILHWLEYHADVAMTLDVPTGPVRKPDYLYKSTKDCLSATLDHLTFFEKNRTPGKTRFLNVLQGNNMPESDAWYDAVKGFEFEGWAFAGVLRHNFYSLCRRIIRMADENKIQNKSWIHVLGTTELETAVMLTALQRAINRHINPNLRISYDTSGPFRLLAWLNMYTVPRFDPKRMQMDDARILDDIRYVGSKIRWPWPSALGDHLVMGDVCVKDRPYASPHRDGQSNNYIVHHNLSALCNGVALANRVFDAESVTHKHSIAQAAGAGVEAIENVIREGRETTLGRYQTVFTNLRHGKQPTADDELRDTM